MNYKKFEDYENYIIFKTGKVFSLRSNIFMKTRKDSFGYLQIGIYKKDHKKRKWYGVHRLLGLLFIPNPVNKPQIDHINRNSLDNRLINLRWATRQEQGNNQKLRESNTSGVKGVSFAKSRQKWETRLWVNGKVYQRGFKSKEEAIAYRRELEIKHLGEDYLV